MIKINILFIPVLKSVELFILFQSQSDLFISPITLTDFFYFSRTMYPV